MGRPVIGICTAVEHARWTVWEREAFLLSRAYVDAVRAAGGRPGRDAAEIPLARRAMGRDLPLLGICRGMQLLNVALGGTLIQHLPDDVGHSDHRRSLGSFDNADHDVRLAEGSLAARAAGETDHPTKSHHHQAIARLGEGLVETGWSTLDELPE